MNKIKSLFAVEYPLKKIDYIIFAVMAICCFVAFQGFNIGGLITCVVYLACGVVVYKIASELGMGSSKSGLCAFAALTMPIGFYCQFIFGGSMSFLLFPILLGFYYWLKDNDKMFLLFFAAAFLFGGQAFLIFITLLLLKRKEFSRIAVNVVLFLVPALVKVFVRIGMDAAYREELLDFTKLEINGSTIMLGTLSVNLTIVVAILVMIYAYMKTTKDADEQAKWSLYLIGLQMFAMFGLGGWEPQSLIIMVPFFTLGAFVHKDTKIFMALDILLMLFFVLFAVNAFPGVADETLLVNGILGEKLDNGIINKIQIKDLLILEDTAMALSFFTVLVLVIAVFKHPKDSAEVMDAEVAKGTMGFIRGRFLGGIAIFLAPAALCLLAATRAPYVTMYTPKAYDNVGYMITDRQQSEVFISTRGELESVEFCIGTYNRDNDVDITVRIADASTGDILFEEVINVLEYGNYDWVYVDTNELKLTPGGTYRLDIVCLNEAVDATNSITLFRTEDLAGQTHGYAYIDGQRQEYHLCVKIIEDNLSS